MTNVDFRFETRKIAWWTVPIVRYRTRTRLSVYVAGFPVRSGGQQAALRDWKMKVATAVLEERETEPWTEAGRYALSVALAFFKGRPRPGFGKGRIGGDVDNVAKPIMDAVAAGLRCVDQDELLGTDPNVWKDRWPDDIFECLLVHRLPPTDGERDGAVIYVSGDMPHRLRPVCDPSA